ncbi:diguanylate cyclase [Amorphus sp. 3PC139-8]
MRILPQFGARLALAWLLVLLAVGVVQAGVLQWQDIPPIELSRLSSGTTLFGFAAYSRSSEPDLTLDAALETPTWQPLTASTRNQGITADTFRIAFRLVNDTNHDQSLVISHDIANLSTFAVNVIAPDGEDTRTVFRANDPFADRALPYAGPAAEISVPASASRDVVVSFRNDYIIPLHISLHLWSASTFERHIIVNTAFYVFWIACLLMTAVFWTLYGTIMRQLRMVAYAVYMYGLVATYALFSGVGYLVLYPDRPWIAELGFHWSLFLVAAAAFEFARRHLEMAANHPLHNRILIGVALFCLALSVGSLVVLPMSVEAPLSFVAVNGATLYIMTLSWIAWIRDGVSYAKWMVFGWVSVAIGALLSTFGSMLNFPYTTATHTDFVQLAFAATVLESLLLSISLAQWLRGQETARVAAEEAAARDALTGLLNRRGFGRRVDRLAASGNWPGNLWLAAIDIDRFKHINDTHSHAAGDAVLVHLAGILVAGVRAEDTIARFGGEEFVLLFSAHTESTARSVLERTREQFEMKRTSYGTGMIFHTFSAGLVRAADHPGADKAGLVALADQALYAAKRNGRNRVHVFGSESQHGGDGRHAHS